MYSGDSCPATPDNSHTLLVHESSNFERQLRPLMFLSNNQWESRRWPGDDDFLPVIWKGEVILPDQRDQKCVHLDDAI